MKRFYIIVFNLFAIFLLLSCSEENITGSIEDHISFSYKQISGCNDKTTQLGKTTFDHNDSCFSYTFNDKLKIDFCVYGNCCPDSQRFVANYNLAADTIFVEVTDTAENLCYCLCNYTIHIELSGLQKDKYLFYCNFPSEDSAHYGNLFYREYVYKQ